MSIIKPRTRGTVHSVPHALGPREPETLNAYAAYIGEASEYVLNELIDTRS
jgi:hypothetical protein